MTKYLNNIKEGKMDIKSTLTILLTILLGTVSSTAVAITTTTATALAQSSAISLTDTNTSPTSASALVTNNEVRGQSVSNASGHLATSASFYGFCCQVTNVSAEASWTETFVATAGSTAQFNFFIPGAAIGFNANNSGPLSGGYSVEILLNGVSQFLATADVTTTVGTPKTAADLSLTQTGTILNSTFATGIAQTMVLEGAGYRFDAFGGSLNLSPVTGDNILTYSMSVFVNGPIGETSAVASIGDPLNLSQSPAEGVTFSIDNSTSPVPVPAAIWLFGSGLIGLIGLARRKA